MLIENQVYIYDFVWAISEAIDLISPTLHNHHKKVAYISGCIAQEMQLPNDTFCDIILAALLHDIGVFSIKEWGLLLTFEEEDGVDLDSHAYYGYALLKDFKLFLKAANLIRYHHADYTKYRNTIPIGSYIIHLADRVAISIDEGREILTQIPVLYACLNEKSETFHPEVLMAFSKLAKKECFWIETSSASLIRTDILKRMNLSKETVDLETVRNFAKLTSQIIDFRSRFTATHSSGVAAVAMELTKLAGFSEEECMSMEIAGFLHDIGKLAVPNEILEKPRELNSAEFNVIRKHTYYTYMILSRLRGLEHIATLAAYHHERLDGTGYPFRIKGRDISKLSRIMAVADVITALTENRPYRAGMSKKHTEKILLDMHNEGALDGNIVDLAIKNFTHINDIRIKAQRKALKNYDAFHETILKRENNKGRKKKEEKDKNEYKYVS